MDPRNGSIPLAEYIASHRAPGTRGVPKTQDNQECRPRLHNGGLRLRAYELLCLYAGMPTSGVPRLANASYQYTSAVAEARIGGDLYEVVASPHGVRVIVGDVRGKGLAAVETAAVVLGAFREAAHDQPDLVGLDERLERGVARDLEREKLVTAILVEIGSDHEAVFLNYGHPAPDARTPGRPRRLPAAALLRASPGAGRPQGGRAETVPGAVRARRATAAVHRRCHRGPRRARHVLPARRPGVFAERTPDPHSALDALCEDVRRHAAGPPHAAAAMLLLRYHGHGKGKSVPTD